MATSKISTGISLDFAFSGGPNNGRTVAIKFTETPRVGVQCEFKFASGIYRSRPWTGDSTTIETPFYPNHSEAESKPSLALVMPKESSWEEAIEQCDSIISMCGEVPERGEEFAESITEKVGDIRDWIEAHREVTNAQQEALDNMQAGVERWLR